jgi:hypothetical protein
MLSSSYLNGEKNNKKFNNQVFSRFINNYFTNEGISGSMLLINWPLFFQQLLFISFALMLTTINGFTRKIRAALLILFSAFFNNNTNEGRLVRNEKLFLMFF